MRHLIFISAIMLALGACGGSGDSTDAPAEPATIASASANTSEGESAYIEACTKASGDREKCTCLDGVFRAKMSPDVYEFFVVSFIGSQAEKSATMSKFLAKDPDFGERFRQSATGVTEKAYDA